MLTGSLTSLDITRCNPWTQIATKNRFRHFLNILHKNLLALLRTLIIVHHAPTIPPGLPSKGGPLEQVWHAWWCSEPRDEATSYQGKTLTLVNDSDVIIYRCDLHVAKWECWLLFFAKWKKYKLTSSRWLCVNMHFDRKQHEQSVKINDNSIRGKQRYISLCSGSSLFPHLQQKVNDWF